MREVDVVRDFLQQAAPPEGTVLSWEERRMRMDVFGAAAPLADGWAAAPVDLGCPAEHHTGPAMTPGTAMLYLHGGGYCVGSAVSHRGLISQLAAAAAIETFAPNYRLGPEHPLPAGIEDVLAAIEALNARGFATNRIVLAGDSAGGGLALAVSLRLRDAGKPLPAALFLISPWADLTHSGKSHKFRANADPMLTTADLEEYAKAYVGQGGSLASQDASPLFADLTGLPPMLIQVGADEILLSDSETLQSRAADQGVMAALEVWPGMIHVWHIFYTMLSAGREAIQDAGDWIKRRLAE